MNRFKFRRLFFSIFIFLLFNAPPLYADKAALTITAPETAAKGSEVLVKLTITHSANNFFHYINWVYLKVNGKEFARWDYSSGKRPEEASFTKEVKIPITASIELVAEANCNLHGSNGPVKWKIAMKE